MKYTLLWLPVFILLARPSFAQVQFKGYERDTIQTITEDGHGGHTVIMRGDAKAFHHELDGVTITGLKPARANTVTLDLRPYSLRELEWKAPFNLSDALARLPGISQLTTGNDISKPVIRGLYGNRILILLSGIRFDNQQFQDEHGLGLSQIGIDRVEIIRGPASILYGTDAVGGVINIIEEIPPSDQHGLMADATFRAYSNTLGTLTDVGLSNRNYNKQKWWRIRAGIESHGDYSDGNGTRIYDSRDGGYYLKAGIGFEHDHWEMNNSYNFSFNQFGFILDSNNVHATPDARWSRSMANPHHNVLLNVLGSQNTFYIHRSRTYDGSLEKGAVLKLNLGIQSNKRAEDEGGGEISLNMHLLSLLQSARLEKYLTDRLLLIVNEQFTFENNMNYGKRKIVPNANMLEGNTSAFLQWSKPDKLYVELGAGITDKNIHTFTTGSLNIPGKDVAPFSITRPAANGMIGVSYLPKSWMTVKGNIATGVRTGNLAELSSDGLHEGTYRYEIGNKDLKAEQNICADINISAEQRGWLFSASGYYNHFNNYIYLLGTSDTISGIFPVYRYVQQNANLYGGEVEAGYDISEHLLLGERFSATIGKTADGAYLPFIPAFRSITSLYYSRHQLGKLENFYAGPELEYVLAQNHPGPFETSTLDYALVHFYAGATASLGRRHHAYQFSIALRNLLNKAYYDHLSRLKYFGIYNEGFNAVISVSTHLGL